MSEQTVSIDQLFGALTPEEQVSVRQMIEDILHARKVQSEELGRPAFRWVGALRDLRDRYTSVELQHELLEERLNLP
jgi:hypothetical protein